MKGAGAGALYDVGCYPLSVLIGLFHPQSPEIIHEIHAEENGVILDGTVILKEEARSLTAEYSMIKDRLSALEIIGEAGTIFCPEFWKSRTCSLCGAQNETYEADFRSEFTFEAETFVRRIAQGIICDPESEQISAQVLEIIQR
jgi:predicted dehydrogenase